MRLVSLLSIDSSAENDRRRARASRKNSKGAKGGKSQARGVKGGAAKTLADSEEPSDTEDRYEDPKGREGFEKVLRCCWGLLRPDAQRHFLTEANNFVANILQKSLHRDLREEPGRSVEDRLSEKLTELAAGIREGQRAQCGDHLHGSMLILVNYENSVLTSPGVFKSGKDGTDKNVERLARFFYHRCALQFFSTVPLPTVGQCQALQRWKDALGSLGPSQSASPSDVYNNMPTSTTTSGLFMLSATLLCLVAGFLLEDWADFARLAPCCRRLCSIAWNGESWKVVPVLGRESFDSDKQSTWREHFGPPKPLVDGQNCLSRKVVGLLLLALRTFSARPMYLDREIHSPDSARLRSLVISFDLLGLRPRLDFGRERQDLTGMHPRQDAWEPSEKAIYLYAVVSSEPDLEASMTEAGAAGNREHWAREQRTRAAAPNAPQPWLRPLLQISGHLRRAGASLRSVGPRRLQDPEYGSCEFKKWWHPSQHHQHPSLRPLRLEAHAGGQRAAARGELSNRARPSNV